MDQIDVELIKDMKKLIANSYNLQNDTEDSIVRAAFCFLKQMLSDLSAVQSENETKIIPTMVIEAIEKRGMKQLSLDVQDAHKQRLAEIKNQKMQRLKEAGFGATYEHVSFMRAVFKSHYNERHPKSAPLE